MAKRVGTVEVAEDCCKGCGHYVTSCPTSSLELGNKWNRLGYHPVEFLEATGCTGCGVCFYACPEPSALKVFLVGEAA